MKVEWVYIVTQAGPRHVGTKVKEYATVIAVCNGPVTAKACADALSKNFLSIGYEGPVKADNHPIGKTFCINEG